MQHSRARTDTSVFFAKRWSQKITNQELLELECDILVPSALENQITGEFSQDQVQSHL
jgi:glutamate dehydrogenase